jgi:hypothetical protein
MPAASSCGVMVQASWVSSSIAILLWFMVYNTYICTHDTLSQ